MLHSIIDFLATFYGIHLILFFISFLFLVSLDSTISKRKNLNSYTIKHSSVIGKGLSFNFFSKIVSLLLLYALILFLLSKSYVYSNYNQELYLTNNIIGSIILIYLVVLVTQNFILTSRSTSYKQNLNLILTFLLNILPCIYLSNSLIVLFFFIEVISISTFLVLLNSLTPTDSLNKKKKIDSIYYSTNYEKLNSNYRYGVFIYYWISFFFSIFFYTYLVTISNSFNFLEIPTLTSVVQPLTLSNNNKLGFDFLAVIFILLILLKFGLPPFHLQKLCIYKGLPINLSIMYSIIVILGYFFIFSNLVFTIPNIFVNTKTYFSLLLLLTIPFILIVLFKELNIKAFFGYSSILNISILYLVLFLN